MVEGEKQAKPAGHATYGRDGDPAKGQTEDVSARDSLAGDIANKIDPDMGTAEGGPDPVEPKGRGE